ncbi:tRNA (adenosine(37)-N6)-threonylcarbamoyltransferase complex dimerization subunit type 1 TsaB [Paenibacillus fonticola]|uniref:tRNA (adenosine(37)-N6)-threonylcarbamoyltransferase complex dimerization subunit type 1 TsaB n=1 Tax=Paenibacillus fonticola TaxID=379896 RepID=UPI0003744E2E|nr:tRNA (adenosine(37)-N6)-threonylcarbamoyltransferase complex dimerization subunit type 1 TsaB [Paenibacillus fonticola]
MNHREQPRQRLLALDTSTSMLTVAVMEGSRPLAERTMKAERNHSAYLVTAIEEALTAAGIGKNELDGIAAGVGPGSYTGVRIAVTTAKTLAWSLQVPVCAVSSLAAIALGGYAAGTGQAAEQFALTGSGSAGAAANDPADYSAEHWIVPLVDARRGQAYTALFSAAEGRLPDRLEPDAIRLMADWRDELAHRLQSLLPDKRPLGVWFVGDAAAHEEALGELRSLLGEALHMHSYELEAVWLGLVGAEQFLCEAFADVHSLEPNYTQLAEAEAKKLR